MPDITAGGFAPDTTLDALRVPKSRVIHRCSECFGELYEADRGCGSTAWACPVHAFNRRILEIPASVEDEIRQHPEWAAGYVKFIRDNLTQRESRTPLTINGVPAAEFIKRAYGLGADCNGDGRYDHGDPVQTELRHIKGWIEMAQRDALDARSEA